MTVEQRGFHPPADEYAALSTDTFPTEDIEPGSLLRETDTLQWWTWDGVAWTKISREDLTLRLLWSMNQNLERILDALQGEGTDD